MNKRGTTLIETAISIFLIAVVIVTFLEALSVGINGTLNLNRKTSALMLAKSQIEHTKTQEYQDLSGNLSLVYGTIMADGNISDTVNYIVSGEVTNASETQPLQQIAVTVSYMHGKEVQVTGYKTDDGSRAVPPPMGLTVTDNIQNVPNIPQGYSWFCADSFKGFYYVFTTGTAGPASATWTFEWERMSSGASLGAPMMAVYQGVPDWVNRDAEGEIRQQGIIIRPQGNYPLGSMGDLPGPGGGAWLCDCYSFFGCEPECDDEADPIAYAPHHCGVGEGRILCWLGTLGWFTGPYPCCGGCFGGHIFWSYDDPTDLFPPFPESGIVSNTLTTGTLQPGQYTVLFFNAENRINLDTITAAVAYQY